MHKLFKIFSVVLLISISVKIVDVLKSLIIASLLGVSNDADIYMSLLVIPDSLLVIIGLDSLKGIVNSEYSALYKEGNFYSIWNSFKNLFPLVLLLSLILTLIIILFKDVLIKIALPGFDELKLDKTLTLAWIILPVFFFRSIIGFLQATLNSLKKFYLPALSQVIISLTIIASIFLPYINHELIMNLSFGYLIGNVILTVLLVVITFKLWDSFKIKRIRLDPLSKKIIKNAVTIFILVFINQIYLSSRNYFASYFGDGAISTLNYASSMPNLVNALVFASVFSVLLSDLSTHFSSHSRSSTKSMFLNTLNSLFFLILPIVIVFIFSTHEILSLLYLRGKFSINDIYLTVKPFRWESLSMLTNILYIYPTALFLAKKRYILLTILGSLVYMIGILLNYVSSNLLGYYGVTVANFITTLLYGVTLLIFSRKFIGKLKEQVKKMLTLLLCGLGTALVAFIISNLLSNYIETKNFLDNLIKLSINISCILITYYLFTSFMKVNFLPKMIAVIRRN